MNHNLLVVRSGDRLCGIPVEHVEETMRPLPIEVFAGAPEFVRGVSIVRGRPTPIVDLNRLLGSDETGDSGRLVTLKVEGERRIGLLTDGVVGIHKADRSAGEAMPPLLRDAKAGVVRDLERLDGELLTVLRATRLLSEEVWTGVAGLLGAS